MLFASILKSDDETRRELFVPLAKTVGERVVLPTLPLNPTTINWQPIPTSSYIINDPLVDPNVLTNSFIQPLAESLTSAHQVDDYQMASGLGIILMSPYISDYKVLSFRAKLTDNNGVVQYSNIETIAFYNVNGSPVAGTNTSGI